ncbi:MAG TPA: alpha/beta fold hydrolase, partial [Longimicrobiales bacterium]|nr:alpha/beta fold hydrolase [Longimicrobiales bacterium]
MTPSKIRLTAAVVVGLVVVAWLGPRARVGPQAAAVEVPPDVEAFLVASEADVPGIRAGDAKRITWASEAHSPTPLAVVYLHGFSADPHELDPVPQRLADSLGANLFVTRLAGHGLEDGAALGDVSAEDWLRDTEESLAVGARLGGKVVLVGTSTGGTLAVWAAAQSRRRDLIAAVVLVSPNFGPRDGSADMLLWPWGGLLARLAVGPERCWTPLNAEQERHWTTCYPTRALLPMMALVEMVRELDPARVTAPTLVLLSPDDQVVDPDRTRRFRPLLGSTRKELVEVTGDVEPSHHVLAGDIVSPATTDAVTGLILDFVRGLSTSR